MSKTWKKILGFATFWPFAYFLLFFLFIIGLIATSPGGDLGPIAGGLMILVMLLHFLTIMLVIGLQIFYIYNIFKNPSVKQENRIVWVIALVFGGLFAMPVYWYMNIWKGMPEDGFDRRGLPPGDGFEAAGRSRWETMSEDPVPPEPHSWR